MRRKSGEAKVNSSAQLECGGPEVRLVLGLRSVEVTQPVYIIGDIFGWARLPMLGPVALGSVGFGWPHP
jgi:hypothetical protein